VTGTKLHCQIHELQLPCCQLHDLHIDSGLTSSAYDKLETSEDTVAVPGTTRACNKQSTLVRTQQYSRACAQVHWINYFLSGSTTLPWCSRRKVSRCASGAAAPSRSKTCWLETGCTRAILVTSQNVRPHALFAHSSGKSHDTVGLHDQTISTTTILHTSSNDLMVNRRQPTNSLRAPSVTECLQLGYCMCRSGGLARPVGTLVLVSRCTRPRMASGKDSRAHIPSGK
jgi:hypothetical protein